MIETLNNTNPNDIQSARISTVAADASFIAYAGGYKTFFGTITATDQFGLTGSGSIQVCIFDMLRI